MKELKLEDGNIVAVVEWTPRGAEYLKNKEYRYLSPVVNVRKMDNKAIGLHSLALTNTPAIENMTPIVNSDNFEGGHENMDMQKLAAAPGLGPDATEEQIMEALQAMVAENKSLKEGKQPGDEATVANKAVCELLGLKAGAPTADVTAKIMELKSGTIDGVNLLEELKALKNRLNRITGQLNGIGKMLDENRYCGDILIQVAAVESALQSLAYRLLQEHMESCVVEEVMKGNLSVIEETIELVKKLK